MAALGWESTNGVLRGHGGGVDPGNTCGNKDGFDDHAAHGFRPEQGRNHHVSASNGLGGGGVCGGTGVDKRSGFVQRTVPDPHLIIIVGDQMLGECGRFLGKQFHVPQCARYIQFKRRVACDVQLTTS